MRTPTSTYMLYMYMYRVLIATHVLHVQVMYMTFNLDSWLSLLNSDSDSLDSTSIWSASVPALWTWRITHQCLGPVWAGIIYSLKSARLGVLSKTQNLKNSCRKRRTPPMSWSYTLPTLPFTGQYKTEHTIPNKVGWKGDPKVAWCIVAWCHRFLDMIIELKLLRKILPKRWLKGIPTYQLQNAENNGASVKFFTPWPPWPWSSSSFLFSPPSPPWRTAKWAWRLEGLKVKLGTGNWEPLGTGNWEPVKFSFGSRSWKLNKSETSLKSELWNELESLDWRASLNRNF